MNHTTHLQNKIKYAEAACLDVAQSILHYASVLDRLMRHAESLGYSNIDDALDALQDAEHSISLRKSSNNQKNSGP